MWATWGWSGSQLHLFPDALTQSLCGRPLAIRPMFLIGDDYCAECWGLREDHDVPEVPWVS